MEEDKDNLILVNQDKNTNQLINKDIFKLQEEGKEKKLPKLGGFEHGDIPLKILQVANLEDRSKLYVI